MVRQLRTNLFLQLWVLALGAVLAVFLTSCDVNDGMQTGQLQVTMTDAPADYDAVYVDIQRVLVHKNANVEPDTSEEESSRDAGWVTLSDEPMRIDLLTLRNGNEITLGETELETGTYSQLRLILGSDNEVVVDGQSHSLQTPSAQQTGIKLNINADIEDGETYSLLVDFDAGRSVVETGNGNYLLKPVLRAANLEATGSISGSIQPADVRTGVWAISGDDSLSTWTDDEGSFTLLGVAPGTYEVQFRPEGDQYADSTRTGIEVDAQEETDLGTIALEEK